MKNIITVGLILLSIAVNAQNIKLGENKSTQEYLKQASACYYMPQWNTSADSVALYLRKIESLASELDKVSDFMEQKYTEAYLGKMAQDYATKIGSSPDAILAMGEVNESIQTIGAKLAELNTEMESELEKLKPLEEIYNECGLNLDLFMGGAFRNAEEEQNRKLYTERFPNFYAKAVARQKQVIVLRKSYLEATLKLQYELVDILQKKYNASKLMMLEQFLEQQKVGCYQLIKEYVESCKELCKPYQMYQLRDLKR
ncbi:hypothetical protein [Parabacteroides sp.]